MVDITVHHFTGTEATECIIGIIATIDTGSRLERRNLTTGG
jgi:hypothetical protein